MSDVVDKIARNVRSHPAGRHEGWQWAVIEDDVALDNMPLIQQYKDDLDMRIKYQAVVVPREVLSTIAAILELST